MTGTTENEATSYKPGVGSMLRYVHKPDAADVFRILHHFVNDC
jgi:hypothetical protein